MEQAEPSRRIDCGEPFVADQASITVVDQNDRHVYQPGLLFIPFGKERADRITRPRGRQLHRGVDYRRGTVESIELASNTVHLVDGSEPGV